MKLPRDLSGADLVRLLRQYGYEVTRQSGSHVRLSSNRMGMEHHITIPAHSALRVGTLNSLLTDIARYLEVDPMHLRSELFGR